MPCASNMFNLFWLFHLLSFELKCFYARKTFITVANLKCTFPINFPNFKSGKTPGGGVLPCIRYIGMCRPIGLGF